MSGCDFSGYKNADLPAELVKFLDVCLPSKFSADCVSTFAASAYRSEEILRLYLSSAVKIKALAGENALLIIDSIFRLDDPIAFFIPNKWVQMVRYYGSYSNKMRGVHRQAQPSAEIAMPTRPNLIPPPPKRLPSKKWRDLIQQVWHTAPLRCPGCQNPRRVMAAIDQREVVETILHLHRHLAGRLCSSPPKARKNA